MLQALRNFGTRNVVISNGETISVFGSPIDYFRGTVGSILSTQEVNKKTLVELYGDTAFKGKKRIRIDSPYTRITEKKASILNLKNEILFSISNLSAIPKDSVPDLHYLLVNGYLEKLDIEKACDEYFLTEWDSIISFLHNPKYNSYPNVVYNLKKEQKNIIAYLVSTKKITERQLGSLHISLKRGGYNLEYFMETCYDETFFDNFIDKLMKGNRTYI